MVKVKVRGDNAHWKWGYLETRLRRAFYLLSRREMDVRRNGEKPENDWIYQKLEDYCERACIMQEGLWLKSEKEHSLDARVALSPDVNT